MTGCSVPQCSEMGIHHFSKDPTYRKLWIKAIRRKNFQPKNYHRLCRKHFVENDYEKASKSTGLKHKHKYLKKAAIPTVFSWNQKPLSSQAKAREERLIARNRRASNRIAPRTLFQESPSTSATQDISHEVEVVSEHDKENKSILCKNISCSTQTSNVLKLFSTELLQTDEESVKFYTGLENYSKLSLVLSTLMPMANDIKYLWSRVVGLSVEDQFIMLLIKLRRNKPDSELSRMFGVSKTEVSNVIITWINFVSDIWSLLDLWPSRELVNFYMPQGFKTGSEISQPKSAHRETDRFDKNL